MLQYLFGFLKLLSPIGSYLRVFFLSVFFFKGKIKQHITKFSMSILKYFNMFFGGQKKIKISVTQIFFLNTTFYVLSLVKKQKGEEMSMMQDSVTNTQKQCTKLLNDFLKTNNFFKIILSHTSFSLNVFQVPFSVKRKQNTVSKGFLKLN